MRCEQTEVVGSHPNFNASHIDELRSPSLHSSCGMQKQDSGINAPDSYTTATIPPPPVLGNGLHVVKLAHFINCCLYLLGELLPLIFGKHLPTRCCHAIGIKHLPERALRTRKIQAQYIKPLLTEMSSCL
jgi:hypothetical protein